MWNEKSKLYSQLKTRVENIIKVYDKKSEKSRLKSIKDLSDKEELDSIKKMLKEYYVPNDDCLTKNKLIEKYRNELIVLCQDDKETTDMFGYVNTWWVFGEVAKELDYDIFMAEAEEVGYKRTKRGEKKRPNDLYRVEEDGSILVDDGIQEKILDYMREIEWE